MSKTDQVNARVQRLVPLVREYEGCDDVDCEDLLFNEVTLNPDHTDKDIAQKVAMLITQA